LPSQSSMSVNENVAVGTVVGTIAPATDIDSSTVAFGQQRYYFWDGSTASATTTDGRYRIDAVTGQVTTNASLNYEAANPSQSYTVIARDNAGATGYNQVSRSLTIAINNVNEANSLPSQSSMSVNENVAVGKVVDTIAPATDIDSSTVAFGQQRYYFWNGSTASATTTDGRYRIDAVTGQVTTNASLNYEAASPSKSYTVIARDNAGATGYNQVSRSLTIAINNVNEAHSLVSQSYDVSEQNVALGPFIGVTATTGQVLNVANLMLSDPEGGSNITYRFAGGSNESGPWTIDGATGAIWMTGATDYEELVELYETQYYFDGYILWEYEVYTGRDTSLATFDLAIEAVDNGTGLVKSANLTLNVTDVDEAPLVTSTYAGNAGDTDSGVLYKQDTFTYWVHANRNDGPLIVINPHDPERATSSYTYSLTYAETNEILYYYGGSGEADGGAPLLAMTSGGSASSSGSTGTIYLNTPGDGEWEGAYIDEFGQRKTSTLYYSATVTITDATGHSQDYDFEIVFLHRGSTTPPIVFDLDGDGLELVSVEGSNIYFDMDIDGVADQTGWVAADDGMLALDRNGNGVIDDITEISFAEEVDGAISDLEGLRAYDTNANGFFDSGDDEFGDFVIWQDANQDGISQAEEMMTLAEAGIVQINLTFDPTGEEPGGPDNVIYATSEYLRDDGTTGTVGDVFIAFEPSDVEELAAPVILDFDGDGEGLLSLTASSVRFDMDGDGIAERTGWIEADDAFLALDRNGDGEITDIAEISFLGDLEGAQTDLEGLAAFDSNGDGMLSALDDRFAEFKLWFDSNSNGVSDAGELRSFAEVGLVSISLTSTANETYDADGNLIYGISEFALADGTTGSALDAALAYVPGNGTVATDTSAWNGESTPSTDEDFMSDAVNVERREFDRKTKKYKFTSFNGQLYVRTRKEGAIIDSRAGQVVPSAVFSFANKDIGVLSAIVLDLNGSGIGLRSIKKAKAAFDMNGDGIADNTGWIKKKEGFLVIDRNGDGMINGAAELSFMSEGDGVTSSMAGLASLDSNGDGVIDSSDERFGELKVWADRNGNGVTDEGELGSLANHGIVSFELNAQAVNQERKVGKNMALSTATFTLTDGTIRTFGDIALAYKPGEEKPAASAASASQAAAGHGLWYSRIASIFDFDTTDLTFAEMIDQLRERNASGGEGRNLGDATVPDVHDAIGEGIDSITTQDMPRLALMRQHMAAFGGGAGLSALERMRNVDMPFADFHA